MLRAVEAPEKTPHLLACQREKENMNTRPSSPAQRPRLLALAGFVILALVLVLAGSWYYLGEKEEIARDKYQMLSAIGEIKADQIEEWRKEHLAQVARAARDPNLAKAVANFLNAPDNPSCRTELRDYLNLEVGEKTPAEILLFDSGANLLFGTEDFHSQVSAATREAIRAALVSKEAVVSGFYRSSDGGVQIDIAAAVRDVGERPLAVLILRHHAKDNLFPMLQFWPAGSRSTETVLAQREGGKSSS